MDRKLTVDTIEKMKQPKTIQHKKNISKSITNWWEHKRTEQGQRLKMVKDNG